MPRQKSSRHRAAVEVFLLTSPLIGPPLPTILLIGRDLAKTRGGKRGQISPMVRFVCEFSAARVTAGFLGTWVSPSNLLIMAYRFREAAKGGNRNRALRVAPLARRPQCRIVIFACFQ